MTKYFNFRGLAKRQEYWAVVFISFAASFIATLLLQGLMFTGTTGLYLGGIGLILLFVVLIWLQVATTCRRCRDAGISPWWVLLLLIPYVNFVAAIVYGVLKTKEEENA